MVPFGVNIVRNDVGEPEAEIGLEFTARKGAGARLIERTDESKLFFIALFPELAVACALIQNAPNIDGGVVIVRKHHLPRHLFRLRLEVGVLHLFEA